jgi:hypothetical protein
MPDPDKTPIETPILVPSSAGIVAKAGTSKVPVYLDLDRDGIADYQSKTVRRALAQGLFWVLGTFFPKSPWALALKQLQPQITELLELGSK